MRNYKYTASTISLKNIFVSEKSSIKISPREFHISCAAREKYSFDETLYSSNGNVILADFAAVRKFANVINEEQDAVLNPEKAVRAGHLHAMGLIDEILHV